MNTDWILPGKSRGWRAGGTARHYRVSGHRLSNFLFLKDKSWDSFLPYQLKRGQYFLYHNKWVTVILVQSSGMTEEIMEIPEKKTENEDSLEHWDWNIF